MDGGGKPGHDLETFLDEPGTDTAPETFFSK